MPRISDIAVLYQRKQPALSVRTRTKVEDLPMLIGSAYAKMAAYLKEKNEILADVPFVAYHNMDMQDLDVEIGFPVVNELEGEDEIKPSAIMEGKVVFCMYRGAYHLIEPVYMEMLAYIEENKMEMGGCSYEYYYNGPNFPEEEYLTKIIIPVK